MRLETFPQLVVLDIFDIELNNSLSMAKAVGTHAGQIENFLVVGLRGVGGRGCRGFQRLKKEREKCCNACWYTKPAIFIECVCMSARARKVKSKCRSSSQTHTQNTNTTQTHTRRNQNNWAQINESLPFRHFGRPHRSPLSPLSPLAPH